MKNGRLRVLHTSDWHIGHIFFDKKRDDDFRRFFEWLADIVKDESVDCLLVAGDIYDTSSPSSRSQQMYYDYLKRFRECGCRHIVITAGNHDPAILLDAPQALFRDMNIHVLGEPDTQNPENEVLVLHDPEGNPELIVCAVPFLREKYVRKSAPGESPKMKEDNVIAGIYAHYASVAEKACNLKNEMKQQIPLVAMGHLFAGKNSILKGDESERTLYVGTLGQVGCDLFGDTFDYVALGHLHLAQTVDGRDNVRYSGSPLPMSFSEHNQIKSVTLIEFDGSEANTKIIPIPAFRKILRISGTWLDIEEGINKIADEKNELEPWLEIIYKGEEYPGNMREKLDELGEKTGVEILVIRDMRTRDALPGSYEGQEELGELEPEMVFKKCLSSKNISVDSWPDLLMAFNKICASLDEEND